LDYCRIQQSKLSRHLHHNGKRVVSIDNADSDSHGNTERNSYGYANPHSNANSDSNSYGYANPHSNANSDIDADFSMHRS
jgi:hypothetical protein